MDLHLPYWRLDSSRERAGLLSLARRLTKAVPPVWHTIRAAAPRASEIILLAQVLSGAATTVALLLTTAALGPLIAEGATSERLRAALPTLLMLLVVLLVQMIIDAAMWSAKAHLVPKVGRAATEELYRSSLAVELESFDDPNFYDQLHRARDRGVLHLEGLASSLVDALGASFSVVGAGVALCWLHPLLLLILVLALVPEGWAALNAARLQYAGLPTTIALLRKTEMMSALATQREAAPEIRANQAQDYVFSEYSRSAVELQDHVVNLGLAEARSMTLGRILSGVGLIGTFVALGFMLHFQWLGLAVSGTAIIAIRSTTASLATLVQMAHQLFEKGLYISDYRDFIEQSRLRRRPSRSIKAPPRPGRIELHEIRFRYPGARRCDALNKVSFTIEDGQTIALAGENGSGKTTLAKLIAGLYRPTSGRITWDGVDTIEMDPDSLADRVVMVQQQPIHWPRSAKDNVRLGRHARIDPNADALMEAARGSRALEVIEGLPEGWETLLSREFKGGQDLSAGQWQRLAVARGLYRDAPVVIWDEPTAPLDAKAEHAVYESLRKLAADRTVILITHRLASIRNADRIFFLDHGMLVEQGDHQELLRMNGRYAELYRLQTQLHGIEK